FVPYGIDTRNFGENDPGILLVTENCANRGGDVPRGQSGGRDLIEQRLEQVVVVTIDDRDLERRLPQLLGDGKSSKTRSDDHDAGAGLGSGDSCHDLSRPNHAGSRYAALLGLLKKFGNISHF